MVELETAVGRSRRTPLLGTLFLVATVATQPAFARRSHHPHRGRILLARAVERSHPAHIRPGSYTPPFSAFAIDGNSGRVLYGQDENALRHPASITKVMTLYLLFERLEKGHLSLDDRIEVSDHAAAQSPTKLGLRPGSTIRIEDAVKAIVTKSANDMAVAIAERIGGDEHTFAQMMTRKAHALGMSRSNFVNASGLPDDQQLTTARDLATLGRAIHDRYPRYFRFFSTPSFRYAGQFMPNHNHLMEQVEGMDGIKTGYTRSSGFNLLSSVNRNGHWLVSVVLGGKSRLGRDRIMAELIAAQIDKCATARTAPMIAENPALEHVAEAIPVIQHEGEAAPPVEPIDDDAAEAKPSAATSSTAMAYAASADDGAPAASEAASAEDGETAEKPVAVRHAHDLPSSPVQIATAGDAGIRMPHPRPAFVTGLPRSGDHDMTATGSIHAAPNRGDGATTHYSGAGTSTPSTLKHGPHRDRAVAAKPIKVASLDPAASAAPPNHSSAAHGGWMIQVGATPTVAQANDLIARAKGKSHGTLNGARAFTEKVQKGGATLFRARFAGLEESAAASACRSLKHDGLSCFAARN